MRWNPTKQALLECIFIRKARTISCLARLFHQLEEVDSYVSVNRRYFHATGKAVACAPLARFYNEANTQGVCYQLNNDLTLDEPSSECNFDRVRDCFFVNCALYNRFAVKETQYLWRMLTRRFGAYLREVQTQRVWRSWRSPMDWRRFCCSEHG